MRHSLALLWCCYCAPLSLGFVRNDLQGPLIEDEVDSPPRLNQEDLAARPPPPSAPVEAASALSPGSITDQDAATSNSGSSSSTPELSLSAVSDLEVINDERVQVNERLSSAAGRKQVHQLGGRGVVAVTYRRAVNEFLEQTRGVDWLSLPADQRPLHYCRDNLSLKGRGCGLLVPVCTNFAQTEDESADWSCTMIIWQSCSCSSSSSGWRSWLPSPSVCYGDKTYLLDLEWDGPAAEDAAEFVRTVPGLMIPTGHCGQSSFFLLIMFVLVVSVLLAGWAFYRGVHKHLLKRLPLPTAASGISGEPRARASTDSASSNGSVSGGAGEVRLRKKNLVAVDG